MKDYCLFIPYVNRPDLLQRAVNSVASLSGIRVINNSGGKIRQAERHEILPEVYGAWVIVPNVPLTFAQTMNFALTQTDDQGAKYCLTMHSDAEADPGVGGQLLTYCREEVSKWGCIFTAYDALVAFNVAACRAIGPWDTNLPWYLSDCDYYRRLRLAGYTTLDSGLPVKHEPSQTLKASPRLEFLNRVTFPLAQSYYRAKWGGDNGREIFTEPWNGKCPKE